MRNMIAFSMLGVLLAVGVSAVADEGTPDPAKSNQTFMKRCMDKARAANNGTSEKDMKKACEDQLKTSAGQAKQPVVPAH